MPADLSRGRIVWLEMLDPQGRNPKVRPAVILTATPDIHPDGTVLVAAITSEIGLAPADTTVPLPWHHDGHPRTKLRVPSEVVCTWLGRVPVSVLTQTGGFVPANRMIDILAKVAATTPNPTAPPPEPPAPPPTATE